MDKSISFRRATSEDGEELLAVHLAAIMASDQDIYPQNILTSWAFGLRAEGYGEAIAAGEDFEVAQTDEGRIVAFCGVRNGEIYGLFVHPSFQRRRIGKTMAMRGETRAASQRPEADVFPLNATLTAVGFYESLGYRLIGRRDMKSRGGLIQQVAIMEKSRSG